MVLFGEEFPGLEELLLVRTARGRVDEAGNSLLEVRRALPAARSEHERQRRGW